MPNKEDNIKIDSKRSISVTASSISGIIEALEVETTDDTEAEPTFSPDLHPVITSLEDIYRGVELATEDDSRGRSRKIVMEFADREDLSGEEIGYHLRVLEAHGLIIQDGNRWRIDESPAE